MVTEEAEDECTSSSSLRIVEEKKRKRELELSSRNNENHENVNSILVEREGFWTAVTSDEANLMNNSKDDDIQTSYLRKFTNQSINETYANTGNIMLSISKCDYLQEDITKKMKTNTFEKVIIYSIYYDVIS